jgi:hypothetical protein
MMIIEILHMIVFTCLYVNLFISIIIYIGEMSNKYNEIFDTEGIRDEYNDNDNYRNSQVMNSINEKKQDLLRGMYIYIR